MTAPDVRKAATWLRRQAEAQEAREALLEHERLLRRNRAARQLRDTLGRWTKEAHADRAA